MKSKRNRNRRKKQVGKNEPGLMLLIQKAIDLQSEGKLKMQ